MYIFIAALSLGLIVSTSMSALAQKLSTDEFGKACLSRSAQTAYESGNFQSDSPTRSYRAGQQFVSVAINVTNICKKDIRIGISNNCEFGGKTSNGEDYIAAGTKELKFVNIKPGCQIDVFERFLPNNKASVEKKSSRFKSDSNFDERKYLPGKRVNSGAENGLQSDQSDSSVSECIKHNLYYLDLVCTENYKFMISNDINQTIDNFRPNGSYAPGARILSMQDVLNPAPYAAQLLRDCKSVSSDFVKFCNKKLTMTGAISTAYTHRALSQKFAWEQKVNSIMKAINEDRKRAASRGHSTPSTGRDCYNTGGSLGGNDPDKTFCN